MTHARRVPLHDILAGRDRGAGRQMRAGPVPRYRGGVIRIGLGLGLALVAMAWGMTTAACKQTSIAAPGSPPDLKGVYAAAPDAVWAVGEDGTIRFYDGVSWGGRGTGTVSNVDLRAVHGTGPDDVWAVGGFGLTYHFDGNAWTNVETPRNANLEAVWAVAPDDVWATGAGAAVLHYDGTEWREEEPHGLASSYGIWVSDTGELWVAGSGIVAQYDGATWVRTESLEVPLYGLHGAGEHVFAVGTAVATRFDGTTWTTDPLRDGVTPLGVWVSASGEAWAAGYQGGGPMGRGGALLHFDGATWTESFSGSNEYLRAIHGTGPSDIWAVGDRGRVMHWDGDEWTVVTLEEEETAMM